ncbi:MAG: T9SS type A sorting domain-containing protein [Bacteroidetes bacterium]|nr:MAG: T9SS type A sorting domain-containing protein [Bacteroidota bacterium]
MLKFSFCLFSVLVISILNLKAQTWAWLEPQVCGINNSKIANTPDGGFIMYGNFKDSIRFGGNFLYADSGTYDMYIARYDKYKNVLWTKSFGGTYMDSQTPMDQLNDLKIDINSNLVFAGSFAKQFIYGNDTLNSIRDWQDGFIASCDSLGNPLWIRHFHGRAAEGAYALFLDDADNMYLGCSYIDYDPIDTIIFEENHLVIDSVIIPFRGNQDNCLMKINANGKIEWVNACGGKGNDFTDGYSFDTHGMLYVAMRMDSTLYIGSDSVISRGYNDLVIVKYDTTGDLIWKKQYGNSRYDNLFVEFGDGPFGYIFGRLDSITTIDGVDLVATSGNSNCFIAKIDSSGSYIDSKIFSSTGYNSFINHLVLDDIGNLYFVATTWGGNLQIDTFNVSGLGQFNSRSFIVKADENLNALKVITANDFGRATFNYLSSVPAGLLVLGKTDTTLIMGADTMNNFASCMARFMARLDFTISVDELTYLSSLSLFPNPATERAELLIKLNQPSKALINIYSMEGVLVASLTRDLLSNVVNRVSINLESYTISKGMYICVVQTGVERRAIKLIVQ